jgi:hypothetical protein
VEHLKRLAVTLRAEEVKQTVQVLGVKEVIPMLLEM